MDGPSCRGGVVSGIARIQVSSGSAQQVDKRPMTVECGMVERGRASCITRVNQLRVPRQQRAHAFKVSGLDSFDQPSD